MKVQTALRLHGARRVRSKRTLGGVLLGFLLLALALCANAAGEQTIDSALGALQHLDYAGAAAILEHFAAAGDPRAQAALATLLESGDANIDTSFTPLQLLRTAAAQNLAPAALELGNRYFLGEEVPRDKSLATQWWHRAAEHSSARAAFNLGLAYAKGDGVMRDDGKAREWFSVAAKAGIAQAWYALGIVQLRAEKQTADYAAACESFENAASAEIATGVYNLGAMHEHGISCELNIDTAIAHYQTAASAGIVQANTALARLKATPRQSTASEIKTNLWIEAQPPANYTLQVASGNSEEAIRRILAAFEPSLERAYIAVRANDEIRYLALIGSYAGYVDALAALGDLGPSELARKPWIRRFSSIQERVDN